MENSTLTTISRGRQKSLPVCFVQTLGGPASLQGVSVMGEFSRSGLKLKIASPSGAAVLQFTGGALDNIQNRGASREFAAHRARGFVLSSHPGIVGNLFRDLGIVVTQECVQVLKARVAGHTARIPAHAPRRAAGLSA